MRAFSSLWKARDPEEERAVKELDDLSDRAAGIVAAAFVYSRLTEALKHCLNDDGKAHLALFRQSGPLGTFSSQIDLGYVIGLYSTESKNDLHTIRDIRNDFAHAAFAGTFMEDSIKDRCFNLKIIDTQVCDTKDSQKLAGKRKNFISMRNYAEAAKDPRSRYIIACAYFASGLAHLQTKELKINFIGRF